MMHFRSFLHFRYILSIVIITLSKYRCGKMFNSSETIPRMKRLYEFLIIQRCRCFPGLSGPRKSIVLRHRVGIDVEPLLLEIRSCYKYFTRVTYSTFILLSQNDLVFFRSHSTSERPHLKLIVYLK